MTASGHAQPRDPGWSRDQSLDGRRKVTLVVDGTEVPAREGEPLAVALAVAGILTLRHSPTAGTPRGMFCLMGVCQECLIHADDRPVLSCLEPARDGLRITLNRLVACRPAKNEGRDARA